MRGRSATAAVVLAIAAALALAPAATATYPGENGKIFFVGNVFDPDTMTANGIPDIWSVNPDGSELVNLTDLPGGPGEGSDPYVSADGTRLVFTVGSQATSEVWIMNADGSNPTQLTQPTADPVDNLDQMPALSPDASKIAFMTTRSTGPVPPGFCCEYDIWLMNADGSNPQPLIEGTGESYNPAFTPDGQAVVAQTEMTGDMGIGSVPVVGGPFTASGVTVVADEESPVIERVPSVSPDGTRVAYARRDLGLPLADRDDDVLTADFAGPNMNVTPVAADTTLEESSPVFSPDGTKIAYSRGTADGEIIIANLDGSNPTPLPLDPNRVVFESAPDWSPQVAGPPEPADTDPPETTLSKKPKKKSAKRKAKVAFTADEPGSTFECKLDKKKFKPCASPHKLKRLKLKRHKFLVRATDVAGNTDKTPAKARFKTITKR